ncbi:MAG: polyprenyl synthetase family protein [Limnochordia bacterium]
MNKREEGGRPLADFKDFLQDLRKGYPLIEATEERLQQVIGGQGLVNQLGDYLLAGGGKRLRPTLTILGASFYPLPEEAVVDLAVAGELIHLASLIHDDIIDGAPMRRGRQTLHTLWNEKVAVLTGDYLFASAFELLTQLKATSVLREMTKAIKLMCEGEVEEVARAFNFEQGEAEYYQCIQKKTAQLLAACCQSGPLLAGAAPEETAALANYGLNLGYAFQIIDDILDLTAREDELGKPVRSDLSQGTLTLPVIHVLQHSPLADELIRLLREGQGHKPRAQKLLDEALAQEDALLYAWQAVAKKIKAAEEALKVLPPYPARDMLAALARQLLAQAPVYFREEVVPV